LSAALTASVVAGWFCFGIPPDLQSVRAEDRLAALLKAAEAERRGHRSGHPALGELEHGLGAAELVVDHVAAAAVAVATGDRDVASADALGRRVLER
jgi:hypothetical protein